MNCSGRPIRESDNRDHAGMLAVRDSEVEALRRSVRSLREQLLRSQEENDRLRQELKEREQ